MAQLGTTLTVKTAPLGDTDRDMASRLHTITNPQEALVSGREAALLRRNLTTFGPPPKKDRDPSGTVSARSLASVSRTAPAGRPIGKARKEVKRQHKHERKRAVFSESMVALLGRLTTASSETKEKAGLEPDSPFLAVGTGSEEKKDGWLVGGLLGQHILAAAASITDRTFDAAALSLVPRDTLAMLKGVLFKRDQPYRIKLPLQGSFTTSGVGAVNLVQSVSNIVSTSEWSTFGLLFDEFYVHALHFRYWPLNDLGGGVGEASAGVTGGITAVTSTNIVNAPICMVSLFHGQANYSTCSALNANSTLAVHHTAKPFSYTWRNSDRFDPHGLATSTQSGTNIQWQGWSEVSSAAFYGGQIQFRLLNDLAVGTGSSAVTMGGFISQYDVSFRSRS